MIQFVFDILSKFKKLKLNDLGYEDVDDNFLNTSELMIMGLIPKNGKVKLDFKIFKRSNSNDINQYLIINKEKIIETIFIDKFMVYKRAYFYKERAVYKQYDNIHNIMIKFDQVMKIYETYNVEELKKVAKYVYKKMQDHSSAERFENDSFEIKPHKDLQSVYHVLNSETEIKKNLKIIGQSLYLIEETVMCQFDMSFTKAGIDFNPIKTYWLTDIKDECQKNSFIELDFNNGCYFYLKAEKQYDDELNIIIFKNLTNVSMASTPIDYIVRDNKNFQSMVTTQDKKMTSEFLMYVRMKSIFTICPKVAAWFKAEMCKRNVSEKSRQEFGFKTEGFLEGDELLVIEALVI